MRHFKPQLGNNGHGQKSVVHVQIKLLFCYFKPIVVHGLFCRHRICLSSLLFQGPPTISVLTVVQRLETLSLTERRSILFSGPLNGRETPIGPVAGHYKNPILPFGLVLNFLLFFRQRFLKQLYIYINLNGKKISHKLPHMSCCLIQTFRPSGFVSVFTK